MDVAETLNDLHYVNLLSHLFACLLNAFHLFRFPTVTLSTFQHVRNDVEQIFINVTPLSRHNELTFIFLRIYEVCFMVICFVAYLV